MCRDFILTRDSAKLFFRQGKFGFILPTAPLFLKDFEVGTGLDSSKLFFRQGKFGFTLIEIIIVTLILGIIAGLAIPQFQNTTRKFQLKTTVDDLAYIMRYAQSRAVIENKLIQLDFEPDFSKYWLTQENTDEKKSSMETFERISGRLGRTFSIGESIKIKTERSVINFYPDGSMDQTRFYVCHQKQCFTISTQEQRGKVKVYEGAEHE